MEPIHILLVEDNEGDILLTKVALEDSKIPVNLSVVNDGKEAIDFLEKQGEYRQSGMPDLLLLDINLPKKNGYEVLHLLKENEKFSHIPVIILTTSSSQNDIDMAGKNYASSFITKPTDVAGFLEVVTAINKLWTGAGKLPLK